MITHNVHLSTQSDPPFKRNPLPHPHQYPLLATLLCPNPIDKRLCCVNYNLRGRAWVEIDSRHNTPLLDLLAHNKSCRWGTHCRYKTGYILRTFPVCHPALRCSDWGPDTGPDSDRRLLDSDHCRGRLLHLGNPFVWCTPSGWTLACIDCHRRLPQNHTGHLSDTCAHFDRCSDPSDRPHRFRYRSVH